MKKLLFFFWAFSLPVSALDITKREQLFLVYHLNDNYIKTERSYHFESLDCHLDERICRLRLLVQKHGQSFPAHCNISAESREDLISNQGIEPTKDFTKQVKKCIQLVGN